MRRPAGERFNHALPSAWHGLPPTAGESTKRRLIVTTKAGFEGRETRELEPGRWSDYFDELNRRLEGGLDIEATLELVTEEIVGPEAERLPLDSITHEDGDDEIAIGLGGRGQKFPAVLWHFTEKPRHVWIIERGEEPEPAVIAIESEDGSRTLLHLHAGR
jgi:hypothetical protein